MKYFLLTLLITMYLVLIILNISGCKENSTQVVHAQNYIMPLAVGNMWVGQLKKYDSTGTLLETVYDTTRIVSDTTLNGTTWYLSYEALYRNDSWGLKEYDVYAEYERQMLHYPSELGFKHFIDTAVIKTKLSNGEYQKDTIIFGLETASTDTIIITPLDTFHCYYYKPCTKKLDGTSSTLEFPMVGSYWYAPGIGPIRKTIIDLSDGLGINKLVWELTYFNLN